ncbi:MAG TPA: hypothetical protein VLA16_06595 [Ideonella sp.]|nr:hypothetical protein [Ideonella sp.]
MNARLHLAALAASTVFAATPALADEYVCTGSVGSASLDNIFVPDGATCSLDRTRAKGNIVVGTGASLYARSISINGNIQAEGAQLVNLGGTSSVGGSVQLVQGGSATIAGVNIKGSLQMESNNGPLKASNNTIGADLQAFQNSGGVRLVKNRIDGNLQCKENRPAPTGQGNRADSKEDQCARL